MWDPAKIAAIFVLMALSITSGIASCLTVKCLAQKYGTSNKFKRTIGVLNCFSGGVFFATCILNILPEGREKMAEAVVYWGWNTEYPLSELLVGIGFLLVLTLEHGAHSCFHFHHHNKSKLSEKESSSPVLTASADKSVLESSVAYKHVNGKPNPKECVHNVADIGVHDFEDSSYYDDATYKTYGAVDGSLDKTSVRPYSFSPDPNTKNDVEIMFENSDKIVIKHDKVIPTAEEITTSVALQSLVDKNEKPSRANIRGIILLSALSLHMIFDGLALGLLQSTQKVWSLLLALALHKTLVFFTIGLRTLELLKSFWKTIPAIVFFAMISPIGVIIGESINSGTEESVQASASAILQGLAAGTFIYVTFFEILQREFAMSDYDLWKVLVTVVGFSLVGVLRLLENEEEGE